MPITRASGVYSLASLFLIITLSGCSLVQVRRPNFEKETTKDPKSLVFLRLVEELDGKPRNALTGFGFNGFHLEAANIDKDEKLKPLLVGFSPSTRAKKEGWIYLQMEPGSYYLKVIPPGSAQNRPVKYAPNPGFWLQVPENERLIYVGSLSVSCTSRRWLFERFIDSCEAVRIDDESEAAAEILADHVPQESGRIPSRLLQDYDKPFPPLADLVPMGIATSSIDILISPHWRKRALSRATGLRGETIPPEMVRDAMSWGYASVAVAAGYLFLYLPPATVVGAILGEQAHDKWQPCMDMRAGELRSMKLSTDLRTMLYHGLMQYGTDSFVELHEQENLKLDPMEHDLRSILLAEIRKIQILECRSRGSFCVEMEFRVRLLDLTTGSMLADRVFVYSNRENVDRQFEVKIQEPSTCLEIFQYCGDVGSEILREEISEGINAVVDELCRNWGCAGNQD